MSGWKSWQVAEVVDADDFQTYLQNQVVQVYEDATARTTALGTAVIEGMVSYLKDTNALEFYNGGSWVPAASDGDITAVTAGTGLTGGGTSGDVTLNADYGAIGSAVLASPTITGTAVLPATTSIGSVSDVEIGYLDGVTSAIQTQLNARVLTTNGAVTTAAVGSVVVRNIAISTATPGTASGMDGDVWLQYTP
jgi:hypothetical protein